MLLNPKCSELTNLDFSSLSPRAKCHSPNLHSGGLPKTSPYYPYPYHESSLNEASGNAILELADLNPKTLKP